MDDGYCWYDLLAQGESPRCKGDLILAVVEVGIVIDKERLADDGVVHWRLLDVENYLCFLLSKHQSLHLEMDHARIEIKIHASHLDVLHILFVDIKALQEKLTVYLAF